MKPFVYVYWRYCSRYREDCDTLEDALQRSFGDYDSGEAWGESIEQDGKVIYNHDQLFEWWSDQCED